VKPQRHARDQMLDLNWRVSCTSKTKVVEMF